MIIQTGPCKGPISWFTMNISSSVSTLLFTLILLERLLCSAEIPLKNTPNRGTRPFTATMNLLSVPPRQCHFVIHVDPPQKQCSIENIYKKRCASCIAATSRYEPSPAQVASSCDVTFAMLADPQSAVCASFQNSDSDSSLLCS